MLADRGRPGRAQPARRPTTPRPDAARARRCCACSPRAAPTGRSPTALFVSPRTATTHVANILAKLGADSRTAAAAYAFRHGLAEPRPTEN